MFFAPLAQKILPYAEMQQSSGTMWNDSSQVWHSTFSSDASHPFASGFASPDLAPDTQTSTPGAGAGSRRVDLSRRAVPQQSLDSGSLAGDITNGRRADLNRLPVEDAAEDDPLLMQNQECEPVLEAAAQTVACCGMVFDMGIRSCEGLLKGQLHSLREQNKQAAAAAAARRGSAASGTGNVALQTIGGYTQAAEAVWK
ncbi:unnamed protein product [Vitrella brassicaformis CCMP3155]|uniref:Uncharacterized protein n=2 Tax=Vitrella brassicaformis TaxID=1169539 RepID=A0A0G4EXY7_VITBC|nr:unnamed protein product [Vitrella brassicaformis CCMP3155]|mmetsp:Transcript_22029/g.54073  ORF Transcript_22029/g.54073 Transcript_22029/m.54073 type:complete len:199 (+) Transcript_22029:2-598(+)|eukprot:CEM03484.1 unnamed protein product [Vitrella brassicaformis CCMP3155]